MENPQWKADYALNKHILDPKGIVLGRIFEYKLERFEVVGVNGRNRKYPIICRNLSTADERYRKFTLAAAERLCNEPAPQDMGAFLGIT